MNKIIQTFYIHLYKNQHDRPECWDATTDDILLLGLLSGFYF